MRVRDGGQRGGKPTYKDVRGPDGSRYLKWRWGASVRYGERYGFDEDPKKRDTPEARDHRRRLRNARKAERREARPR